MKYKVLLAVAALSLLAASCNKYNTQPGNQNDQSNQQSTDNTAVTPQTGTQTKDNANGPDYTPNQTNVDAGVSSDLTAQPEVVEVDMTADGFTPTTITINKGDYVQFVNKDSAGHWPASNPHPTHTDLPGFDAGKTIATGQYYRYQFTKVGSWGYHDHMHPSNGGTVIVK